MTTPMGTKRLRGARTWCPTCQGRRTGPCGAGGFCRAGSTAGKRLVHTREVRCLVASCVCGSGVARREWKTTVDNVSLTEDISGSTQDSGGST